MTTRTSGYAAALIVLLGGGALMAGQSPASPGRLVSTAELAARMNDADLAG